MNKKCTHRFLVPLLCGCMVLGAASSVLAGPDDNAQQQASVKEAQAEGDRFIKAVKELSPHVKRAADGTASLEAPPDVLKGIPKETLDIIRKDIDASNKAIREGKLKAAEIETGDEPPALAANAKGRNGVKRRWWGIEIYFDHKWSGRLVNATTDASAIGGLLVAAESAGIITLPAAFPTGVVAAAMFVASRALHYCNGSKGMVIRMPFAGPAWCWRQ